MGRRLDLAEPDAPAPDPRWAFHWLATLGMASGGAESSQLLAAAGKIESGGGVPEEKLEALWGVADALGMREAGERHLAYLLAARERHGGSYGTGEAA